MKYQQEATTAFRLPVRIYYEDTDAAGLVYYANYLKYMERCRTEWLRSIGHQQTDLLRDPGIAFVVRKLTVDYIKPARLDDELIVGLEVERLSRAQIFFRQHIRRYEGSIDRPWQELVDATVHIVCVHAERLQPMSIPAILRNKLEAQQ
ncbi:MAG TPA: tol-pal system-associated acyl-CoA thioesterase [Candidatus Accumulibacter phosphatis]|nr:MAG: Acyl-CoA thioester hydrolase YbgC [Candidatus Accumulibacter sp. SK-11]HCV13478.1 tol-pal system-associated acyl-CoA thioesterase [Accumulibacter sp.]HRL74504.1 tol-pal system-associated acyl-CoA thioesterase [Candidatus Accumulibacter phosphatis]HRQ95238.1 tol-pal system-associated acyl-CoA thioesterase [Candidatus Accumulibacter phosphatis]